VPAEAERCQRWRSARRCGAMSDDVLLPHLRFRPCTSLRLFDVGCGLLASAPSRSSLVSPSLFFSYICSAVAAAAAACWVSRAAAALSVLLLRLVCVCVVRGAEMREGGSRRSSTGGSKRWLWKRR
jgi:hypothetical protein